MNVQQRIPFTKAATVTDTSLADISTEFICGHYGGDGYQTMLLEVVNATSQALADFALLVKAHADSSYVSLITGSGWNSPGSDKALEWSTGRIDTIAGTTTYLASIRLRGVYSFKFQGKVAASSAGITCRGTLL